MSFWRSNVFKMRICVINIFAAYKRRSMVLPNENGPLDCAFILWCHIEDVVICQVLFNVYCWQKGVISSHGNSASSLLQWRHNEHDGVSNHQHHDCFLNHLFRRRTHKTLKLRITGLCARNSLVTKEFPAQRASNAENVSIWWRHHAIARPFIWFIQNFCRWYFPINLLLSKLLYFDSNLNGTSPMLTDSNIIIAISSYNKYILSERCCRRNLEFHANFMNIIYDETWKYILVPRDTLWI